jgi:hypothetical protein
VPAYPCLGRRGPMPEPEIVVREDLGIRLGKVEKQVETAVPFVAVAGLLEGPADLLQGPVDLTAFVRMEHVT